MSQAEQITVKYSCHACGLVRVEMSLPVRENERDVVQWFQTTLAQALQVDHAKRSPLCNAQSVQDLMIPMDNRDWIGGPLKH